jgi:hypothetical protein
MPNFRVTRLAFITALVVACYAPAHATTMRDLAPADEYFGRMKMSVLGIRNALDGLERRASSGDRNAAAMSGQLALVSDAMQDWRVHYPRDSWLPRFEAKRARVASLIALEAAQSRRAPSADAVIRAWGEIRHP